MSNEYLEMMCEVMKMLYLRGLISSTGGNVSIKLDDNTIAVTPQGFSEYPKFMLRPEQISIIDMNGNHIRGWPPTTEVKLHIAVYRACKDCKAILHTHPLILPFLPPNVELPIDTELKYFLEPKICWVEELRPRTEDLAQATASKVKEGCNIIILQNHGLVTTGRTLMEAVERTEAVDLASKRFLILKLLSKYLSA